MRWFSLLAVLTVATPAYGQKNEAEQLHRAMEKKIRSAKSLQLAFKGEMAGDGMKITCKGTVKMAVGNKFRLEIDADIMGKAEKMLFVSDGKSTYAKMGDKVDPKTEAPEPGMYDKVTGLIARLGMIGSFFLYFEVNSSTDQAKKEPFDLDKKVPIKNFKLGPNVKVGKRDAQVVEYVIELNGQPGKMSVTIDVQSQLPLKLVAEGEGKKAFRMVETITEFTIDGKMDAKVFELPK
jgi:outer membrane lipoprotein-sorting protein